jgi:uncharacterized coiled-coil protein SlyX
MAKFFNLDFHGTTFTVPKPSLFYLFEHQRDLFNTTSYEVQSTVPLGIFEVFVESLKTGRKVAVTRENAGAIFRLAKEFWLEDLLSECSDPAIASTPEVIAALSERISKLERQISSQPLAIAELKESITKHERRLYSLDSRISVIEMNLRTELEELKSGSRAPIATPTPVPPDSHSKSPKAAEFPLKQGRLLDGIISHLTWKHGGNVHDKGIVRISSMSVWSGAWAVRNAADLTSGSSFSSRNQPGQWICWDFREMRVRPTHYTIISQFLKSWVVESSLDGEAWTEIDRKTNNEDFTNWRTASFAASNSAECRFIRLAQTGKNYGGNDYFVIYAITF